MLARASHGFVCPVGSGSGVQINPTRQLVGGDLVSRHHIEHFLEAQAVVSEMSRYSLDSTIVSTKTLDPSCPPTTVNITTVIGEFAIQSFSGNPSELEIGVDLINPAFTASYNRAAQDVDLDDGENATQSIPLPGVAFAGANAYLSRITPNESVTFQLTASGVGGDPAVRTSRTTWRARHWFGFSSEPGPLSEAQVLAMTQLQQGLSAATLFDVTFASVSGLYFHHIIHEDFALDAMKYYTDGLFNTGVVEVGTVTMSRPGGTFTARDIRSGLLDTSGAPIRLERRS